MNDSNSKVLDQIKGDQDETGGILIGMEFHYLTTKLGSSV